MGKEAAATTKTAKPEHSKLPRLPKGNRAAIQAIACTNLSFPGAQITKRPLIHPAIAPPKTGSRVQKVVYLRSTTPFISAVKRVRGYLKEIDSRSMGTIDLSNPSLTDRELVASAGKGRDGQQEEVIVKATGRAIEKALNIALYFQKQDDCKAVLRTGEVGAVDDIEVDGEESARVRKASVLEVGITLR